MFKGKIICGAPFDDDRGELSGSVYIIESSVQAPLLGSPATGLSSGNTSQNFTWNAATGAEAYHFQLSTDNEFTSIVVEQDDLTQTSVEVTDLVPNTTYYWRVRSVHTSGTLGWSSTFSEPFSFTTGSGITAPGTPTLSTPTDNNFPSGTDITLSWDAPSSATSYTLEVSDNTSFSSLVASCSGSGLNDTSFLCQDLAPYTEYFWRVEAVNDAGSSGFSDPFSFITYPSSFDLSNSVSFGNTEETSSWRMVGLPGSGGTPAGLTGTQDEDWQLFRDPGSGETATLQRHLPTRPGLLDALEESLVDQHYGKRALALLLGRGIGSSQTMNGRSSPTRMMSRLPGRVSNRPTAGWWMILRPTAVVTAR